MKKLSKKRLNKVKLVKAAAREQQGMPAPTRVRSGKYAGGGGARRTALDPTLNQPQQHFMHIGAHESHSPGAPQLATVSNLHLTSPVTIKQRITRNVPTIVTQYSAEVIAHADVLLHTEGRAAMEAYLARTKAQSQPILKSGCSGFGMSSVKINCQFCNHLMHKPGNCSQRVCDAAGDMDYCPCTCSGLRHYQTEEPMHIEMAEKLTEVKEHVKEQSAIGSMEDALQQAQIKVRYYRAEAVRIAEELNKWTQVAEQLASIKLIASGQVKPSASKVVHTNGEAQSNGNRPKGFWRAKLTELLSLEPLTSLQVYEKLEAEGIERTQAYAAVNAARKRGHLLEVDDKLLLNYPVNND